MVKLSEKVQKWWSLGGVIICRDHIITPCYEMEGGGGGRGKEGKREGKREGRKEGKRGARKGRRSTHMNGSLNSSLFQELLQYLPLCTHVIYTGKIISLSVCLAKCQAPCLQVQRFS